ncbi:MAG: hypothetical protein JWN38_209 [Candidatus Saccharibacteria bacterium]|nr:hypothetical protein [Candidatus Saccharibacteria bacterium]
MGKLEQEPKLANPRRSKALLFRVGEVLSTGGLSMIIQPVVPESSVAPVADQAAAVAAETLEELGYDVQRPYYTHHDVARAAQRAAEIALASTQSEGAI